MNLQVLALEAPCRRDPGSLEPTTEAPDVLQKLHIQSLTSREVGGGQVEPKPKVGQVEPKSTVDAVHPLVWAPKFVGISMRSTCEDPGIIRTPLGLETAGSPQ